MVTRQQALNEVSGWVAIGLERGSFEESTGIGPEVAAVMPAADKANFDWAIKETARRLRNMGQPRQDSGTAT